MRAGIVAGLWGVLFGLAVLVASSPSRAAELWIATPSACPIGDELSFRTERALGKPLETAAAVRCTVQIVRDGAEFVARLEVQMLGSAQPSRARSLSAPSCEKLTETLALAVSLAIASGTAEPEPAPAADEPAADEPAADEPAADAATSAFAGDTGVSDDGERAHAADTAPAAPARTTRAGGHRFGAAAALVADAGTLPGVGMGAALGATLGIAAFELRVYGTYLAPRSVYIERSGGSAGAEIDLRAASLLACASHLARASELEFGACAGAELGWLQGTGTVVGVSRSGGSSWSAARVDTEARWRLGRGFGVGLLLSALIPWARDEFAIEGVGRVFQTGIVVGRATLGLSYELGSSAPPG
jgi:hypothetical protein